MAKFTDNQLAQLFLQLKKDYLELSAAHNSPPKTPKKIGDELANRVLFALNNPGSSLYWSTLGGAEEANRVFRVLNIFLSTCPTDKHMAAEQRKASAYTFSSMNIEKIGAFAIFIPILVIVTTIIVCLPGGCYVR